MTIAPLMHASIARALLADRSVRAGEVMPKEVLDYWRSKKLRPGFSYLDVYKEEHDVAFTAAKIMRLDVLEALKEELDTAIADGVPFKKFSKGVEARLVELGFWGKQTVRDPKTRRREVIDVPSRLHTIYETNMRVSRAVGQYERAIRNADARPFVLYGLGPSMEHRPEHEAWAGTLLPIDDGFWAYAWPPNGWGCKCWCRTVSASEAKRIERRGVLEGAPQPELDDEGFPTGHLIRRMVEVKTKRPRVPLVPWENARTGEVKMVRRGIDPGFDKRPGEGRKRALREGERRVKSSRRAPA